MNHTHKKFWTPFAALLLTGLLSAPLFSMTVTDQAINGRGSRLDDADPNAKTSLIMHDIGNVRVTISNFGVIGNPNLVVGYKGFEWPINSGNDFLFSAGIWVGAISNGVRLVSTTVDGDNGTGEFWPEHIGTVPYDRAPDVNDWYVSSKNFATFNNKSYVWGAKGIDDDHDWDAAHDDLDHDGAPSQNWDLGGGIIGYDDDGDGLIDEDSVYFDNQGIPHNWIYPDGIGQPGEKLDTGPSGDYNHDGNCNYDPEPHIDEDPPGDISHDRIDNDHDGLVDMEDPDYDGDQNVGFLNDDNDGLDDEDANARGVQEYFSVYQDDIQNSFVRNPDADGHTPLKIEILQRSYAFPEAYASDFILIDYLIRNVGPLPLKNVFIGMFSDPDIEAAGETGDAASAHDGNYYDSSRVMMIQGKFGFWDGAPTPGVFAIRAVKTPVALDQLKVSFANFGRLAGGDPVNNVDKYNMISSGSIMPRTSQADDQRMLIAFGDAAKNGFEIPPKGELPITVAMVSGANVDAANRNAEWALAMYLNDFQGPSAPDVPKYSVDVFNNYTRILWRKNSEASVDAITGDHDFEGYTIERSTDQVNWETIAAYDKIDTLAYPFEWQNFNLGMPTDTVWDTRDSSGITVRDTTWWYEFDDHNLIPGHTYYYDVRAFDQGVVGAGILYSGRTGNVTTSTISTDSTTGAPTDLSNVYVFPNPYRGSHAGEAGGQVNPAKGLIEFPRLIFFKNLPANTASGGCRIKIFSLAGDHLATLEHINGTDQDQWNLLTMNNQEVASGIYYYTIEYKKPSGGTEYRIDKFVVIK